MIYNITAQIHNVLKETWLDYPDDESSAILVYFYGCYNDCYGCHNTQFKFTNNIPYINVKQFYELLIKESYRYKTTHIVFSGGDCLSKNNIDFTKEFLNLYSNLFDICIYTGLTIEEVKQNKVEGFKYIKVGKYDKDLKQESIKTDEYFQLASSNQEIYDNTFRLLSDKGKMQFN